MDFKGEFIAKKYNAGLSIREISEAWEVENPEGGTLPFTTIRRRIKKMKADGTLDLGDNEDALLDDALPVDEKQFLKTGFLDIETTGLTGEFGYCLCAVIKDANSGEYDVFRLDKTDQYNKDRGLLTTWRRIDIDLLRQFSEKMQEYKILVHYNGRNFDIKMLNTRLLKNRLPVIPPVMQLDIYQLAKHKMRLRIKSLDSLAEFLDIGDKEKGHNWEYWQMAANGQQAGFDYVVEHCMKDVDRLERVAKRLEVFVNYMKG